jgi:hypothetical protein
MELTELLKEPITTQEQVCKVSVSDIISVSGNITDYIYTDTNGNYIYTNRRMVKDGEKKFQQLYKNSKGEEVYNLKGVRRPPYNLVRIANSNDIELHLCEGEKDALTLIKEGFTATNHKNILQWIKYKGILDIFQSFSIFIIHADNDKAGEAQAQVVLDTLHECFPEHPCKIMQYPNEEKGDVSDYLLVHSKAELLHKIKEAEITYSETFTKIQEIENSTSKSYNNPFPIDVFPELLQQYIIEFSRSYAIDSNLVCSAIFPIIGSLIGNTYFAQVKGTHIEPAIFFVVNVEFSGRGKTRIKNMLERHKDLNQEEFLRYDQEMKANQDESKRNADTQPPKTYLIRSGTIEGIMKAHANNRRGILWYCDEIKGVLRNINNTKSGNVEFREISIEMYDGGDYSKATKTTDNVYIRNTHISILGNIQPNYVMKYITNRENYEDGFASRFLLSIPQDFDPIHVSKPTLGEDILTSNSTQYFNMLLSNISSVKEAFEVGKVLPLKCPYSEEARDAFYQWQDKKGDEIDKIYANRVEHAVWAKLYTYIHRFAVTLHVIQEFTDGVDCINHGYRPSLPPIEKKTVLNAIRIVEHFKQNLDYFGKMTQEEESNIKSYPKEIQRAFVLLADEFSTKEFIQQVEQQYYETGNEPPTNLKQILSRDFKNKDLVERLGRGRYHKV